MNYAVHLYIEGGERDGETRILGPLTEDEARRAADQLCDHGTAEVFPLATSVEEIEATL